jgi:ABC-type transport system substrate-binding protein
VAYTLLDQAGLKDNVEIVDIAFDDSLFMRYGVTIPVISIESPVSSELAWPFNLQELQQWLDKNGINYHS